MSDKYRIIRDYDLTNPVINSFSFKEFSSFVLAHYKDKVTVVIDSIEAVFTAFSRDKLYIYNCTKLSSKKRKRIISRYLVNDNNIKSNVFGVIYIDTKEEKITLGTFTDTKKALEDIKYINKAISEDIYKDRERNKKLESITLKHWLSHANATLVVTLSQAYIEYYFYSYDRRYNPHYLKIDEKDIEDYIEYWKDAFEFYEKKKKELKPTQFVEQGYASGHIVSVNLGDDGVKLDIWDTPIFTRKELNLVIKDYETALKMIPEMRERIKTMVDQ